MTPIMSIMHLYWGCYGITPPVLHGMSKMDERNLLNTQVHNPMYALDCTLQSMAKTYVVLAEVSKTPVHILWDRDTTVFARFLM